MFDLFEGNFVKTTENPTIFISDSRLRIWDTNSSFNIAFTTETYLCLRKLANTVEMYLDIGKDNNLYCESKPFAAEVEFERMNLTFSKDDICFAISFPAKNFIKFVDSVY